MSQPLVSIVIPSYNHEKYITQCLQSALNQTWQNIEILVVDDGSTDNTRAILEGFGHYQNIHLHFQENKGSSAAINRGIALAKGTYISILNSDDCYASTRVEQLLQMAQTHAEPCLLATGVELIDEQGEVLPEDFWWNRMYADMVARWQGTDAQEQESRYDILSWGNLAASTSNFFFRKDLIENCGGFRKYRYVQDWEFLLRVAQLGLERFLFFPEKKLLQYRMHGQNTILSGVEKNHAEALYILGKNLNLRYPAAKLSHLRVKYLSNYLRKYSNYQREQGFNTLLVDFEQLQHRVTGQTHHSEKLETSYKDLVSLLEKERSDQVAHVEKLEASFQRLLTQKHQEYALDLENIKARLHEEKLALALHKNLLEQSNANLQHQQAVIHALQASTSWKITAPLRWGNRQLRKIRLGLLSLQQLPARYGGWIPLFQGGWRILKREGIAGLRQQLIKGLNLTAPERLSSPVSTEFSSDPYAVWVQSQQAAIEKMRLQRAVLLEQLNHRPLFSIVLPVHNPPEQLLRQMLDSVLEQFYPDWELCIAEDASTESYVRSVLAEYSARSQGRLKIHWRAENGHICVASNNALALARGEYVLLVDHDDLLAPHALLSMACWLDTHPYSDVVYSDEDKVDLQGKRSLPLFKPDWSPTLMASQNYLGHLLCIKRSLLTAIGGFRPGFEGSQDYDLALRLSEQASAITHLPDVLYHWRLHPASTSANSQAKPYAHEAGRLALEEHLRRKYGAQLNTVKDGAHLFTYQPRYQSPACLVSIIIPSFDKAELLEACVKSILLRSTYSNFEIIILNNNSKEAATFEYFEKALKQDSRIKIVNANFPFNCPYLNNFALDFCKGELLVFLNNDTQIITPDWLEQMGEIAMLPDVATVGPMLLYEDGTIQHAGVVVGMGGWADHVFKGQKPEHMPTPFVSNVTTRNVLAVTGACMVIERKKFEQLGRFDEAFEVCGSDVEIGIRAHKQGLQNVYMATVQAYHLESKTRDPAAISQVDFEQSALKYAPYRTAGDPFYNPNLSTQHTHPTPTSQAWTLS